MPTPDRYELAARLILAKHNDPSEAARMTWRQEYIKGLAFTIEHEPEAFQSELAQAEFIEILLADARREALEDIGARCPKCGEPCQDCERSAATDAYHARALLTPPGGPT